MVSLFYWFFFLTTTIFCVQAQISTGEGNFGHTYVSNSFKRFHNESQIEILIQSLILPELEKYFCILNNKITDVQVESRNLYLESSTYSIGEIVNFTFSHLDAIHKVTITITENAQYISHHTMSRYQPRFEKSLKVLSYNIFNYNDFWEKRVYLITDSNSCTPGRSSNAQSLSGPLARFLQPHPAPLGDVLYF